MREASGTLESLCSSCHHIKAKYLSKCGWETVDGDLKWRSRRQTSITSQTLLPTESPMRPLCSGLHVMLLNILSRHVLNRAKGKPNGLCAEQMEPASPDLTALPIAPKHWARKGWLIG